MQLGLEHQVVGSVQSLQALHEAIEAELHSTKCWGLTTEGEVSHTARRPMCFETSLLKAWCRVSVCDCPAARWASATLDSNGQQCSRWALGIPSGGPYRG